MRTFLGLTRSYQRHSNNALKLTSSPGRATSKTALKSVKYNNEKKQTKGAPLKHLNYALIPKDHFAAPDCSKPTIFESDVSDRRIGTVLSRSVARKGHSCTLPENSRPERTRGTYQRKGGLVMFRCTRALLGEFVWTHPTKHYVHDLRHARSMRLLVGCADVHGCICSVEVMAWAKISQTPLWSTEVMVDWSSLRLGGFNEHRCTSNMVRRTSRRRNRSATNRTRVYLPSPACLWYLALFFRVM